MWPWIVAIIAALLMLVILHDLFQKKHALLRNFPIIGHFRYWLESIGPELRQYIVTDNDEERPFSRDQRRWVYASSKCENNYFGFGSDNEMEGAPNYIIFKHSAFPLLSPHKGEPGYDPEYHLPCAKVVGEHRNRPKAFRPNSVINVSGMSYGSISGPAVEALNRGAKIAGCLQSSGEGSISPYHLHGGELVWQVGTGYFGCRTPDGKFSMEVLKETVAKYPQVRAIEIKLSQGAKPGAGGILPRSKITPEIAAIRGIPQDLDCVSPASHREFSDADGLLDFVESIAAETGLPVGIKSAVGLMDFWEKLAKLVATTDRAVDFVTVDGGEGGTGAGPLVFTDHVALPFKLAMSRAYLAFAKEGLNEKIVFVGSGKLGFPETAMAAFALGCDMIAVAREPMLAIGCIQAQRCHTNHCPTGVATQNRWLIHGLDPTLKGDRCANYILTLRKDIVALSRACGVPHPALVTAQHIEVLDDRFGSQTIAELFGYENGLGLPSLPDQEEVRRLMESTP